ncbi:hypothetical protein EDC96DRAFT_587597 [Choanephora cucurbitarum]|nr:hypothetical protein EDC96DRAFT_587597 [Choanephora cucurbitarum]
MSSFSSATFLINRSRNILADMLIHFETDAVETAGAFLKNDACKTVFDNSKGMFAMLVMLKTIANKIQSRQLFELQKAQDCYLRLWQMSYNKNGQYECIRVAKAVVSEVKKDEEVCGSCLNQFMMKMKECLAESLETVKLLEEEHAMKKREAKSDSNSQGVYLFDIVCPKILRFPMASIREGLKNRDVYSQLLCTSIYIEELKYKSLLFVLQ